MSQIKYVRSLDLPKGVPITHFDTLKEVIGHLKGGEAAAVEVFNKYGRQKDSLPNSKEFLVSHIEGLGFQRLQTNGTPPSNPIKEGEKLESEGDFITRFVTSVASGAFALPAVTIPSTMLDKDGKTEVPADADAKQAAVWSYLQGIVDAQKDFPFDLNASTRTGGVKKPAPWAINAATTIINNGSQANWVKKFTEGYVDKAKVQHPAVSFKPFDTDNKEDNITNLARAIMQDEENRKAASAGQNYV